jgi:hypothetical protein
MSIDISYWIDAVVQVKAVMCDMGVNGCEIYQLADGKVKPELFRFTSTPPLPLLAPNSQNVLECPPASVSPVSSRASATSVISMQCKGRQHLPRQVLLEPMAILKLLSVGVDENNQLFVNSFEKISDCALDLTTTQEFSIFSEEGRWL